MDIYFEEGELSEDQDAIITDPDQSLSEGQTYRETMSGIQSFMGWSHIPDLETSAAASDDSPFAGPKKQVPGKVSVQMSSGVGN